MKASTFLGGVTIFVLLLSLAVSGLTLTYPNLLLPEAEKPKETVEYQMFKTDAPEVKAALINVQVKNGAVKLGFIKDENLIYKIVFEYSAEAAAPSVNQTITEGLLIFSAQLESGKAKIILGSNYPYTLNFFLSSGGLSAVLDENCHIETLRAVLLSGGGVIKLSSGFHAKEIFIDLVSGGLTVNVDVPSLEEASRLYVNVSNGGVMIPPVKVGSDVGLKIEAEIGSGGITLNSQGLEVTEYTNNKCLVQTPGYNLSKAKIDLKIKITNGGAIINKKLFPISFGS
jgi:hypothetical protein